MGVTCQRKSTEPSNLGEPVQMHGESGAIWSRLWGPEPDISSGYRTAGDSRTDRESSDFFDQDTCIRS